MNHFLVSTYITTTAVSIFLSLAILLTQKLLQINRMFFYIGLCLLLLSLMSLAHTLIYVESTYTILRELLLFIRVCGLSAGFSLSKLLGILNPAILKKPVKTIGYIVLGTFLAVYLLEIIFNLGIFFYMDNEKIFSTVIFRYIYIPMAYGGLGSIVFFFIYAIKLMPLKHKGSLRILLFGVISFIGFEFRDLSKLMLHKDISEYKATTHNFGIIVLILFIFIFFIDFIRIHNSYGNFAIKLSENKSHVKVNAVDRKVYSRLILMIEKDKLYLDPDISLEYAAECLHTSISSLSITINKYSELNFSMLLNRYRVEEMKKKLSDSKNSQSIFDIGMESGFNSRTSMNRVFYQFEKTTPSKYRRKKLFGTVSGLYANIHD